MVSVHETIHYFAIRSYMESYCSEYYAIILQNKKVLLRERKRHTARCVASTPSAVLSQGVGVSHLWLGGYPILGWGGVPHPWPAGTPGSGTILGYPPRKGPGTSHWGTPPPRKDMGPVEVLWDGYDVPPGKDMGPVEALWDGYGVTPPPPMDRQTPVKTVPSRRTTYAGGKNKLFQLIEMYFAPTRLLILTGFIIETKIWYLMLLGDLC